MMIPIDSIKIPVSYQRLCADWAGNEDCMLRAVSSTGGLTTGRICPVNDYTDSDDKMRKWYLSIWRDLSSDISYCVRSCNKNISIYNGCENVNSDDYLETCSDYDNLIEFEGWVDNQIAALELSYGLEDWE